MGRHRFITVLLALLGVAIPLHTAVALDCSAVAARQPIDLDSVAVFQFNPLGGTDCWGWIGPDGTDYAIYGASDGLAFVDVSTLQVADFVATTPCFASDIQTFRHYCYRVSECGPGMEIFDLQYLPDSVHEVGVYSSGGTTAHNLCVDTARGFAYLVNPTHTGFRIVDLSDPESPSEAGTVITAAVGEYACHDIYARNDTVWAAEGDRHSFSAWDLTNKLVPQLLARIGIPNSGFVHDAHWFPDSRFVATTEETHDKTVKIWDVSDLQNVSLASQFLGANQFAHNVHYKDGHLFVSHYDAGVYVLDVTSPECPVEMAHFDTYPASDVPNGFGAWGVYPYTKGGFVYSSNRDGRLFIFHMDSALVNIDAAPRVGSAPLIVSFDGYARGANREWQWSFGDGDSSTIEDPVHTFEPGLYDVALNVNSSLGSHLESHTNYITALAESLSVLDTVGTASSSVTLDVVLKNHVPVVEMTVPILVGNLAYVSFDSVVTTGCRTDYFERKQLLLFSLGQGKYAVRLTADAGGGSPPLTAGSGPILRVYLKVHAGTSDGTRLPVSITSVNSIALDMKTLTTQFVPDTLQGGVTVYNASARFDAAPVFGTSPLNVSFHSQSTSATAWLWDFGDGDSSDVENPMHLFGPGEFDVSLKTMSVVGPAFETAASYITSLAETLVVRDTSADVGVSLAWDISLSNHVPIKELVMPILLSNIPAQARLDSITFESGRMAYFESKQVTYNYLEYGAMAYHLTANVGGGSPALAPGEGPIATIHLSIKPNVVPGQQIKLYMPGLGINTLKATTDAGSFTPVLKLGNATITGTQLCSCPCHADPSGCDSVLDVIAVVQTINIAFRGGSEISDPSIYCPYTTTDVDCSGDTGVLDVVKMINVAFRGMDPAIEFCDPCP